MMILNTLLKKQLDFFFPLYLPVWLHNFHEPMIPQSHHVCIHAYASVLGASLRQDQSFPTCPRFSFSTRNLTRACKQEKCGKTQAAVRDDEKPLQEFRGGGGECEDTVRNSTGRMCWRTSKIKFAYSTTTKTQPAKNMPEMCATFLSLLISHLKIILFFYQKK